MHDFGKKPQAAETVGGSEKVPNFETVTTYSWHGMAFCFCLICEHLKPSPYLHPTCILAAGYTPLRLEILRTVLQQMSAPSAQTTTRGVHTAVLNPANFTQG